MRISPTVLLVAVLLQGADLGAQLLADIDTITVSSLQIPLRIHETGRSITVLEGRTLRLWPAFSLDEILQTVTGLEVQSRNGFGAQADILMRGSTFTQVLMLVDGMRLNDPLTAHFNGNIPVTRDEIELIEILRGPAAAMYGPDAVGGVINIITRTFTRTIDEQQMAAVSAGLGSYGQWTVDASAGQQNNRWKWSGGLQFNRSSGQPISEKLISPQITLEPYQTYFDVRTVGLSGAWYGANGVAVKVRTSYDYRDFNARYFYTSSPLDKAAETVANSLNTIHVEKVRERSSSDVQLSFKHSTDEFVFSPDFPSTNTHQMGYFNLISNHLFTLSDRLTLKAGWQLDHRFISSTDRGDHSDWHTGLYAVALWRPVPALVLTKSARVDYDQNYGLELLPQLNLSYNWRLLTLRGAAGRSIRAADYTERFVSHKLMNLTPGRSLGNPDLLAESSWSQEVGADFALSRNLVFKSTMFFRQSDRLIDYVLTTASEIAGIGNLQPGASYFFARNIADVRTSGVEFEVQYRHMFSNNTYYFSSAGLTLVGTSNADDVISVYLSNHATALANTHHALRYRRWELSVSNLSKVRPERFSEPILAGLESYYSLWNARLGLVVDRLQLHVQVQNIGNVTYHNILGAPMPGRWLHAGIRWEIL